jgi:hypothetical protein
MNLSHRSGFDRFDHTRGAPMSIAKYKRILLKVSGEVLAGDQSFGIEPKFLNSMAAQIVEAAHAGTQIAIVIGAGNIFRGMAGLNARGPAGWGAAWRSPPRARTA